MSWVEQLITASRDHTVEPSLRVLLYHQAGMYARRIGQHQRGKVFYDEELQLARLLGDRGAMDYGLWGLGSVARELGDYERAAEYFEEALAIGRAMQDTTRIAEDLTNLGDTFVRMAAYERAVPVLEEAVTIARRNANALRLTEALAELAAALTGLGQRQAARACAEESLALSRDLEAAWDAAMALSKLGLISLRDGAPDWAAALWSESLQQFYTMGEQPRVAREIEHLAYAAHTLGQFERAARLLGAAEALRDALGIPLWPADQPDHDFAVAETHLALGSEAALAASWAAGRAMPVEGVVADALGTAAL